MPDFRAFLIKYFSMAAVTSKSAITPSFRGRTATMEPGVRPSISLACLPTASTSSVRTSTATTEGSRMTMPLPRINTNVLAVPKSMPMSLENIVNIEKNPERNPFAAIPKTLPFRPPTGHRFPLRRGGRTRLYSNQSQEKTGHFLWFPVFPQTHIVKSRQLSWSVPRESAPAPRAGNMKYYSLFSSISQDESLHKPIKTHFSLYMHLSSAHPTRYAGPRFPGRKLISPCCQTRPLPGLFG